jgi:ApbE superfamily uncharacterized protein (UPF0280 family)
MIEVLPDKAVLVDCGPMRMVLRAFVHGKPMADLAERGGAMALQVLADQARFLPLLKQKALSLEADSGYPEVVRRMIEATKSMGEADLTPLAAVAGAASDVVADFILRLGGTKILADNGGDVAIRLRPGESAVIGVKTAIAAQRPAYAIPIDFTMGVGGVATSGLGGRSFTKGIASAVTVLAESASLADAAATVVANATRVEHPCIEKALADNIYPDTDLVGEWVTKSVGELPPEKIREGLAKGLAKAESLFDQGLIQGALIVIRGKMALTEALKPKVRPL